MFLYGVAALFSMNFLQSSVMMTIMAWVTLVCVIVNHCFVFLKETGQKYHNNGLLVYYGLLMVWYISIVFFYIYNANNATVPSWNIKALLIIDLMIIKLYLLIILTPKTDFTGLLGFEFYLFDICFFIYCWESIIICPFKNI